MPNTVRILHLTESLRVLKDKIIAYEHRDDKNRSQEDYDKLTQMRAQRDKYEVELNKLHIRQKTELDAFFGKK
jgi:hypothetical protein